MAVKKRSLFTEFTLAGVSSTAAVLFTNPVEVVKTRLQLQGELSISHQRPYKGVFHAFFTIISKEGITGIQKGLVPGMAYQLVMNGTRLGLYGPIKELLGTDPKQSTYFIRNVFTGALTGTLGAMAGSPFFMIKTRLQSQSIALGVGHQHKINGLWHGFVTVINKEGIFGLFRGINGAVPRLAVGSAVQLSSYDQCKHLVLMTGLLKDNVYAHFAASLVAGLFVTTAMNPFDVISTRLYNQKVENGKGTFYKGVLDCFAKTIKKEGVFALYKGWLAHYLRLGPHTILTFVFWEQAKRIAYTYKL